MTFQSNVDLGNSQLSQFNPTTGVLLSATLNLTSTRTQSVQVTSTDGANTGGTGIANSVGVGTSTARVTAPGILQNFASLSTSDTCSAPRQGACTGAATTGSVAANFATLTSSLDSYVGTGQFTVNRLAPVLSAEQQSNLFTGTESTRNDLTWAGTLSTTYTYELHAAPSFDGTAQLLTLDLDFGAVSLGETPTLAFTIFNLAGERVGLDLGSITSSGDTAKLTTNLLAFTNLGAASSNAYLASLDTTDAGTFSALYLLSLSDTSVGAAASRTDYLLTLNLTGTVVSPVTSVPEPSTCLLLASGLAGLLGYRRRTQRRDV
ncbi:MAG: choice-of-anchor E domain-containing protein [Candidatus Tectimicrobiota bacterium]